MKKIFIPLMAVTFFMAGCQSGSENTNTMNTNSLSEETPKAVVEAEGQIPEFSRAVIKTSMGDITVEFYSKDSPRTVNNFIKLAQEGFYDKTKFHRVINDFMIQGGDPLSKDDSKKQLWGTGGPGYEFADEFNSHKLVKGSLAMANAGPDTNGSQFFIVTKESTPWLDGKHTNFGFVVAGMDVVDKIGIVKTDANDRPVQDILIEDIGLIK